MMGRCLDWIALKGAQLMLLAVTGLVVGIVAVFVDFVGAAFVGHTGWLVPMMSG